jgi:UDPglucose--hexose-1-phosphate uridylyltransferase
VVPENLQNEVHHGREHHKRFNQCIFCSLIDEALTYEATIYDRESGQIRRKVNVGQCVIKRGERFVAIKPFASRFEWEIHILPLRHQADFLKATAEDLDDFANVLRRTMTRLDKVVGGVQYNFFLHSAPHGSEDDDCAESYHWHLEICPRTSIPTGFELGSGLFVSTVSPELAAQALRDADPETD